MESTMRNKTFRTFCLNCNHPVIVEATKFLKTGIQADSPAFVSVNHDGIGKIGGFAFCTISDKKCQNCPCDKPEVLSSIMKKAEAARISFDKGETQ